VRGELRGGLERRPPRAARALARFRLPAELAEAVTGDLEEEYRGRVLPSRGRVRADLWFWGQVVGLRAGALRRVSRRLRAMRPTWERNRPRRVRAADRDERDLWSRMPMRPEDLKYAVRRLVKSPGFTLVAVLSLALGIGANTAMFSLVNAVLLRSLPVEDPASLVEVYTSEANGYAASTSSYPDFVDLRDQSDVFSDVVGERTVIARIDRDGEPGMAFGEVVSWDFFDVLGVRMALGRSFLPEEDETPMTDAVAILGYRTWQTEYGGDPGILGRTVRLSGRPFTVVGVAPKAYNGTFPVLVTSFYAPLMMSEAFLGGGDDQHRRGNRSMFLKARLAPGVTTEQANAALKAFSAGLAEKYPDTNEERVISAIPSGDVSIHPLVDKAMVPVAGLLLSVVGVVLLIACVNLASFLLARAEERRKEIAVRLALGAGRAALIRQLLVETTLLALLGGAAGIALARWTLDLLMGFKPPIPVPIEIDVSLDRTVLLFTLGVSVVAGLLFGMAPALQATNPDIAPTLKDEGGRTGKPGRFNLRGILVVTQVAFSFVLLIGAGLFVRSLQKAQMIDPGFYTGPAAMVMPMLELSDHQSDEQKTAYYRQLEERLLADPDIDQVAMADRLPIGFSVQTSSFVLPGVPSERPDGAWDIDNTHVTPAYFDVMEVPLVSGRLFTEADEQGEYAVVVSQAFVDRYYPGRDMVGSTIRNPRGTTTWRIIGVARDTKVRTLGEAPRPFVYQLQGQAGVTTMVVVVRGRASGPRLLAAARRVVREVDPDVPLFQATTMNEHLSLMLFAPRMAALLLSVFGGLALALAGVGIYGVVSHSVSRRTRELGIRMSLGASARDVVVMAVGGGMRLVVIGGVLGVALAAGVTWALKGFLYGIGSTDLVTFAAIPLILSGVALLAALVPARRASGVDPVRALRSE